MKKPPKTRVEKKIPLEELPENPLQTAILNRRFAP
jgi:hypothetical protein